MINAISRLMNINVGTAIPRKVCYQVIPARSTASVRLICGSGTRYVAVDVPLAKLGFTTCPEVRGASKASDRDDRDSQ